MIRPLWKTNWQLSIKLGTHLMHGPAAPHLASSTVAKKQKDPMAPHYHDRILLHNQKEQTTDTQATSMNLKIIILGEARNKRTYYTFPFI